MCLFMLASLLPEHTNPLVVLMLLQHLGRRLLWLFQVPQSNSNLTANPCHTSVRKQGTAAALQQPPQKTLTSADTAGLCSWNWNSPPQALEAPVFSHSLGSVCTYTKSPLQQVILLLGPEALALFLLIAQRKPAPQLPVLELCTSPAAVQEK